ncbi:EF-hand domain-containing protein [Streptomyces diastatochromogenes]|nr:EF-hand domain-containing protein [Streptomyces diastatochromogenes]
MATAIADPLARKYQRVFKHLDADGNGYIEQSDFASFVDRLAKEYKLPKTDQKVHAITAAFDAIDTFAALDTDGDGGLSCQECVKGCRQYFNSNSLDEPGSWFFGRF